MRLTLRTMLAYMDNVLDPADAEVLGTKIEESDFATGLKQRIQGVLKKLRMDAPKLDGKGMGNDANTVAEYLDSSLPQDRVGEFERVCLESDKHLCEVAAGHQILALVLGKPADVPEELRERVYALGDPARATVHTAPPATATISAQAAHSGAPPVVTKNGQPTEAVAPLEVPDYLRGGREPSLWPFVAIGGTALALTVLVLWQMGTLKRAFRGGPSVAMAPDKAADGKSEAESSTGAEAKSATSQGGDKTADHERVAGDAVPAPAAESVAASTATVATGPALDQPATELPDRATATNPTPAIPVIPDGDDTPAPAPPTKAANVKLPSPKTPVAKSADSTPPAKPQATEVGRYTSEGQLLATLDRDDNLWYSKQPQEVLTAGERLVVLPPYRPQLALPSAVQLTFAGEGAARMEEPGENNIPRVTIESGRFLVATAGKPGAQVELHLTGIKGTLTLVDADTLLAIKVIRWVPPGIDPEAAEGNPVIEMYNANGRATWQQSDRAKVDLPARHVHVYYGEDPPETHGPFFSPEWIDDKSVRPIDRAAREALERMVDKERPLTLSLQEAMKDRRVEVRALAAKCLAGLDDFEPVLRELSDPNQYSFWTGEFESLRRAVQRSPQTATQVREAISLLRAADAKELYRLLWGYSEEQLEKGGAAVQLVKFLEHEQMDVRVLAFANLASITSFQTYYQPQKPPAQMKTPVRDWNERLKKGAILYKAPPSPLDRYRPIEPAAGEPRPPAPAPAGR